MTTEMQACAMFFSRAVRNHRLYARFWVFKVPDSRISQAHTSSNRATHTLYVHCRFIPGGSSSGSGAAVGGGLVSFALGTDTAGSGTKP